MSSWVWCLRWRTASCFVLFRGHPHSQLLVYASPSSEFIINANSHAHTYSNSHSHSNSNSHFFSRSTYANDPCEPRRQMWRWSDLRWLYVR